MTRPEMIARCVRAVKEDQRWAFWEDADAADFVRMVFRELARPTIHMMESGRIAIDGHEFTRAEVMKIWIAMMDRAGR